MELVSCLMVTKDRLSHFRSSFHDFCRQDYPERELVIVTDGEKSYIDAIRDEISARPQYRINLVVVDGVRTLGELRNISVESARGTLLCQWDDDDRYHSRRLTKQIGCLHADHADACFLTEQLQLFADTGDLYWCDWVQWRLIPWAPFILRQRDRDTVIPGSLLVRRTALPRYDPALRCFEDAIVKNTMFESGLRVACLRGSAAMNIYVYHGKNTYDRRHHFRIPRHCGVPVARLRPALADLTAEIADYRLDHEVRIRAGMGRVIATLSPEA